MPLPARGRYRIAAIVTDKKDNILGYGTNSYTKSHPLQKYYSTLVGESQRIFLHAELAAIIASRGTKRHSIYIARVDRMGEPKSALACGACQTAIRDYNIQKVVYTI